MSADRGFIVFTERAGGELKAWWGTRGQFEHAVEDGFLASRDWTLEHAPEIRTDFESIMWAPPEVIMRPVGPGGTLRRTEG